MATFEQSISPETALQERLFLAQNYVQGYYAELAYRNQHPEETKIPEEERVALILEHRGAFESWYTNAEGNGALKTYALTHKDEQIIAMKDMDTLVRSFLKFLNRSQA